MKAGSKKKKKKLPNQAPTRNAFLGQIWSDIKVYHMPPPPHPHVIKTPMDIDLAAVAVSRFSKYAVLRKL